MIWVMNWWINDLFSILGFKKLALPLISALVPNPSRISVWLNDTFSATKCSNRSILILDFVYPTAKILWNTSMTFPNWSLRQSSKWLLTLLKRNLIRFILSMAILLCITKQITATTTPKITCDSISIDKKKYEKPKPKVAGTKITKDQWEKKRVSNSQIHISLPLPTIL